MIPRNSPESITSAEIAVRVKGSAPRRGLHGLRRVLALMVLVGLPVVAQSPGTPSRVQTPGGDPVKTAGARDSDGGLNANMEARRIAQLNMVRQKSMVSDADKLLLLARQLQDDADAGGTKLSDAERLRKAAEIEKLAKDVKTKMVFAIGGPDPFAGPFAGWQH